MIGRQEFARMSDFFKQERSTYSLVSVKNGFKKLQEQIGFDSVTSDQHISKT